MEGRGAKAPNTKRDIKKMNNMGVALLRLGFLAIFLSVWWSRVARLTLSSAEAATSCFLPSSALKFHCFFRTSPDPAVYSCRRYTWWIVSILYYHNEKSFYKCVIKIIILIVVTLHLKIQLNCVWCDKRILLCPLILLYII